MSRAAQHVGESDSVEPLDSASAQALARTYSSGEAARLLGVSRRQLNQSVRRGDLAALRTPGGHLRFSRISLVRGFRRLERPIPEAMAGLPGQRLVVADDDRHAGVLGVPNATRGLVEAAMLLSHGEYELVAIELEPDLPSRLELVRALRSFPRTAEVAILGVSAGESGRGEFIRAGGDLAISRWSDAPEAAAFLLGIPPARLLATEPDSPAGPVPASACPSAQRVP